MSRFLLATVALTFADVIGRGSIGKPIFRANAIADRSVSGSPRSPGSGHYAAGRGRGLP